MRSHKKRYGFEDTPSDICLCKFGIEDTRHFLLSCPFYASKRVVMVSSISDILLKNNLNYPANLPANELDMYLYRSILLATIKFIRDTNRFAT